MNSVKTRKSKDFSDLTLAYGLLKRMNGFHFCYTGDQELIRLGFMIHTDKNAKPYVTAKGKKFLMEAYEGFADKYPEDKSEEEVKKEEVDKLVKNLKARPTRAYHEPQLDDEDEDEDEEDEVIIKKKEKPENDSQA